jgi:hypothetical protein
MASPKSAVFLWRMTHKTACEKAINYLTITILLSIVPPVIFSQTLQITPKKLILVTSNFDSLVRSYVKKGFNVIPGERQAVGIFTDTIALQDGFSLILSSAPPDTSSWQRQILAIYGNSIASLIFETDHPDSVYKRFKTEGIPLIPLEYSSDSAVLSFALDSCKPIDIIFQRTHSAGYDSSITTHQNHVYRLDWVLLSAGNRMEQIFRKIFDATGALFFHQGCCDYWRTGPADDFTFFRFEPPLPKANNDPYWLSIEADNFYFAY